VHQLHRIRCVSINICSYSLNSKRQLTRCGTGSYPFQDDDPFVIKDCPHLYVVGSQPKFDTTVIEGPDGQMVRLIAVPRFSETGELLLVDSETLEVERVVIDVFYGNP
jgi:DNA polymerase II small subunit/DNA polymerase delta subunit B